MGRDAFTAAARAGLGDFGARRVCRRIAAAVYAALADGAGVAAQRPGALERAFSVLGDWKMVRGELAGVNRSEEHTSELQSRRDLVCRLLLEKKKKKELTD